MPSSHVAPVQYEWKIHAIPKPTSQCHNQQPTSFKRQLRQHHPCALTVPMFQMYKRISKFRPFFEYHYPLVWGKKKERKKKWRSPNLVCINISMPWVTANIMERRLYQRPHVLTVPKFENRQEMTCGYQNLSCYLYPVSKIPAGHHNQLWCRAFGFKRFGPGAGVARNPKPAAGWRFRSFPP